MSAIWVFAVLVQKTNHFTMIFFFFLSDDAGWERSCARKDPTILWGSDGSAHKQRWWLASAWCSVTLLEFHADWEVCGQRLPGCWGAGGPGYPGEWHPGIPCGISAQTDVGDRAVWDPRWGTQVGGQIFTENWGEFCFGVAEVRMHSLIVDPSFSGHRHFCIWTLSPTFLIQSQTR